MTRCRLARVLCGPAVSFLLFVVPAAAGGFIAPGEASGAGDMRAQRDAGARVAVSFTPACNATGHTAYWGAGPITGGVSWTGADCGLGVSGRAAFDLPDPAPGAFVYFVLVGQDSVSEGSYGRDSGGVERAEAQGTGACDRPRTLLATCAVVDFSLPVTAVKSQSGFLHSLHLSDPPDEPVVPLAPAQWRRHNFDDYARITGLGARFAVVLSDMWGYPNSTWGWPFEHYTQYESWVRQQAQTYRDLPAVWDVWNEPDGSYFWGGTYEQFLETYRRTWVILRQELVPRTMVGGPSLSWYNRAQIKQFADFCRANGCAASFLSWHELGTDLPGIESRIKDARDSFVTSPAYASLRIREILVNEVIGPKFQHSPGGILGELYYLERGGSDGACKACWTESNGIANCDNNTLDGLLTQYTYDTRAGWWAYKAYADGVGARVASSTADPGFVALGSSAAVGAESAQAVVGYFDTGGSPATTRAVVTLARLDALPFLAGRAEARVRIEKIPATGEAPLAAPFLVSEDVRPLVNGALVVPIDALALDEAYLFSVSAPQ